LTVYHYCFWFFLLGTAVSQGLRVLRDAREALSPCTIVIFGFVFLYVVSYLALDSDSKISYLSSTGYLAVLAMACASSMLFYLGFHIGRRSSSLGRSRTLSVRTTKVFAILLVGIALSGWFVFVSRTESILEFYSAVHGESGKWTETSAYLYDLRLFLFPGLFWLFILFLYRQASRPLTSIMVAIALFLVIEAWLIGSRGDWLRLMVLAGVPLLLLDVTRAPMKRRVVLAMMVIIGIIVLTPYIRVATHLGSDATVLEVAKSVLTEYNPLAGSTPGEGNELIVAAAVVQSARNLGVIDYGLAWLHPAINFVPRFIWQDKPYYSEWSVDIWDLVQRSQGWTVAVGAAETGVADAFQRFGWLSPLVWAPLGFWGGRLFRQACQTQSPVPVGYLAAYLIGLIYMVTQGFKAAFYGWFFFALAVWGLRICAKLFTEQGKNAGTTSRDTSVPHRSDS
jgi:hypothetical protein